MKPYRKEIENFFLEVRLQNLKYHEKLPCEYVRVDKVIWTKDKGGQTQISKTKQSRNLQLLTKRQKSD